jgi:hypothetical protein
VHQDVWTKVWTTKGVPYQFHDGINHFEAAACPCQGQHSDGKPCNKKLMLQCKFCPWTRLSELKGGKFQTWSKPVACRDTGEVPRNAYTHVHGAREGGNRGWHQFWYVVHSLYPEVAGGAAAGGAAVGGGPPGDRQQMIEWFARKVNDYPACKNDFEGAGLLVPGCAGAAYGIVKKFRMADEVLRIVCQAHPGMMAPPKAKRRLHLAPSRSMDADIAAGVAYDPTFDAESFDDGAGASKRVKTEVHFPDSGQAYSYAPQYALPLPSAGGDEMGNLGFYNSRDQDPDDRHVLPQALDWWKDIFSPCDGASSGAADRGSASGAAVQPLQAQHVADLQQRESRTARHLSSQGLRKLQWVTTTQLKNMVFKTTSQ